MTEYKLVKQEGLMAIYEPIIEPAEPESEIDPEILASARQLHDLYYESMGWPYDFDTIHPDEKTAWIMVAQFVSAKDDSE